MSKRKAEVLKVYVQDTSGDYNLERDCPLMKSFAQFVESVQRDGGYYTQDYQDRQVFVPWHRIAYISTRRW